jgi:tricorn protease-like protein
VTSAGYLRFPHIHGDLITFVADDDVWLAPAAGGRAWRVTADHAPATYPRISRDGALLAWTSGRDGPPEVYLAAIDGGNGRRLSYWVTRLEPPKSGAAGVPPLGSHHAREPHHRLVAPPLRRLLARARCRS